MLVFAKNENGVFCIGGYKIYGLHTNMPPTDIPYTLYEIIKNDVCDATYREGYLEQKFKKKFPGIIAFKYMELEHFPEKTVDVLGKYLGGRAYKKRWGINVKIRFIKGFLKDVT